YSTFPSATEDVPVVSESSGGLNMELLAEVEPDLIIADVRIDNETRAEIEEVLGIPVIIDNPSQSDRVEPLITYLGTMLDAEETASELLEFINHYLDLVEDRVSALDDSEKPLVYYEWVRAWFSCSSASLPHQMLTDAGGLNLAADEESTYPTLSPEYVLEQNPDVVIRVMTSTTHNVSDFEIMRAELMNRTGLTETTAVQTGAVFVMDGAFRTGIRNHLGLLTLAKCFHPDLFEDIDITEVHTALLEIFFGVTPEGVYIHPYEATEPETEPEPTTVTVVDKTGASIELQLPLERIVNIAPGAVELICALGHEDKIVGRDTYSTFPPSVESIPVVGDSSFSPNLELIIELDPDLVIADEGLSEEHREMLDAAGIPVLIEMFMEPRLTACMNNLGTILNAKQKAGELIEFYETYEYLVTERLSDLDESEKPSVYFEWYMPWYSTQPDGSWRELITTAGGIDIIAGGSVAGPEVTAEYVTEQNPDIIVRMLTRLDGEDLAAFQTLTDELLTRNALSGTTAVENQDVYAIKNTVLVLRRPIGLLYLAKWFHPTLFADIDPSAVHEEMIDKFFGLPLEGEYAYPEIVTVEDGAGNVLTIKQPVERIVTINSGLTEILYALGCEDRIVGRDESSTLPPAALDILVVADNSYVPNVEMILELEPDLLFADSMLPYNTELYEQIQSAGIMIFISDPSDPEPAQHAEDTVIDFSAKLVTTIASIVGAQETAEEYVTYVQSYNDLVKERLETITEEDRPKVLLEWYAPYNTFVTPGLDQAGGINIAENQTEYAPVLSAEFVIEQDPDIIIRAISSYEHLESDFVAMRDEIMSRPELSEVTAVQTGQVYIYDWASRGGIRCVVGYLYWAKWCQPDLFDDIDPVAINSEIDQMFFGTTIPGVYAYP
ncbi:MAG: ABC transporter substrate-binding protein, partial [Candidatus Bathyarchaeota archaeon]|nr:ABC transporter substrate-binding protein [Candidatus Bathyarchaeota archaeon]